MQTIAQIQAAKTAELVAFWNEHNADKQIKKFSDRATAEARCIKLLESLGGEVKSEDEVMAEILEEAGAPEGHLVVNEVSDEEGAGEEVSDEEAAKGNNVMAALAAVASGAPARNDSEAQANAAAAWSGASRIVRVGNEEPGQREEAKKAAATVRGKSSNSAGVAASWADPEVFAARLKRDGVVVTVDGQTTEHKSVRDAFRHYRLPDSKHIRFRLKLKASGAESFEHNGKAYAFQIVQAEESAE